MISSDKSLTVIPKISVSAARPTIWICTAASPQLGFGHLKRSIVLAGILRDCCKPLFLLDPEDYWSIELLRIQDRDFFNGEFEHAWALFPDPGAILIDTRLSRGLEDLISTADARGIPTVSIHDLGLNPLPSNIVIDGSIAPKQLDVSRAAQACFGGPDYMILDPAYQSLHRQNKSIEGNIRSIFINLGGGDSRKYFLRIMDGLRSWGHELEVIGVPGFASWGQEDLGLQDWKPVHFRWENQNIERFLFQSDLAITAGGITAYEALCAGTPLLALSYDHLQRITVKTLAHAGACVDLGSGDELDPSDLAKTLSVIDAGIGMRSLLSRRGRQIVDGRGAARVAEIIRQSMHRGLMADCQGA